jgi:hypothetical protein
MGGKMMLDPRWHWLNRAAAQAMRLIDPDEAILEVAVVTRSAAGELLVTTVPANGCPPERALITDEAAAVAAGHLNVVSLTPDEDL